LLGGIGSYLLARRTLEPIEAAHEAQTRFTADASHELRTPLAAMRAETEVALRNSKLSAKEARELLHSNLEELTRLTGLSEGLLQLARGADDGNTHELLSLSLIIEQALAQVRPLAQAKAITIRLESATALKVLGNIGQLTQAVVILLDNAIKYSPRKTTVAVSVTQDHQYVRVSVADHGRGISETDLPHVFERFYRADSARTQADVSGHGLGLSIAEQIVTAHGGHLEAQSTLGKGSRFTMLLPIVKT
jgi:signal transduction histidine kinase